MVGPSGVHLASQADVPPHASEDAPTPSAAVAATVTAAVTTLRKIRVRMIPGLLLSGDPGWDV